MATWWEKLTHQKRLWCWERLRAGGEGSNRRGDSWMASPTWWTWFWANFGRWWRMGKPAAVYGVTKSQTWLSDWTTYVIGFDLISMDEFENNRWFASGGYAKYHYMFANFISEKHQQLLFARRNINNLRYIDDTTLMTENEGQLKSLLMKVKEEWKSWLKTQHSKN